MTKRQVLEFVLFFLVAGLLAWIFCLSADYAAVEDVRSRILAMDRQDALFSRKLAELQGIDRQLSAARQQFDQVKKWAAENSLAEMLAFCEQVCQQAGLHLRSFEPGEKIDFDFYTARSVTMHLTGPFQAQTVFLQALSRFEKLLSFERICLQKDQTGTALNMQVIFQTYGLNRPEGGHNAYEHEKKP